MHCWLNPIAKGKSYRKCQIIVAIRVGSKQSMQGFRSIFSSYMLHHISPSNEFPGLCQLSAIPGLCQLSAINIELGIYLGETPYKCNTKKKYQYDFSYSKNIANLEAFRYVIFSSINLFFWRVGWHSIIFTYIITLK